MSKKTYEIWWRKIKPMTNCENEELSTGHNYTYDILEYLLLSIVLKFVIFFWYCPLNSSMESFTSANMYSTINSFCLLGPPSNWLKKWIFYSSERLHVNNKNNKAKCCSRMFIKFYLYTSFSLSGNKKVNRKSSIG